MLLYFMKKKLILALLLISLILHGCVEYLALEAVVTGGQLIADSLEKNNQKKERAKNINQMNSTKLCRLATKTDGSQFRSLNDVSFGEYVKEAFDRNYSIIFCNDKTGRGNKKIVNKNTNNYSYVNIKTVCSIATNSSGSSFESRNGKHGAYVQEAWDRGYTLSKCNQITGKNSQSKSQEIALDEEDEIYTRNAPSITLESFTND